VIEFRPLTESDLPLVEEWLGREHVAPWWRDSIEESLAEYRDARGASPRPIASASPISRSTPATSSPTRPISSQSG
jgi:hypothetical protein